MKAPRNLQSDRNRGELAMQTLLEAPVAPAVNYDQIERDSQAAHWTKWTATHPNYEIDWQKWRRRTILLLVGIAFGLIIIAQVVK